MLDREMQEAEMIGEEDELDYPEYPDDSPYYHCPAYPEFDGWRDLL